MTPQELAKNLDDPLWRLSNLYKIIVKGDEDDEGLVLQFKPNRAQRRLLAKLHHRNIILKARQLGFTTLVCILWLDTALFSKNPIRCAIIAQDKDAAEAIFRGKVRFAYDNLPDVLRERFPLKKATQSELEFEHNGASIKVATSVRSGTIHRLHVSEFGKICAKYPDKAQEVVTGSIPAVPKSGVCIIESTAEGQDGHFYTMTQRAQALNESGAELGPKDWRFHFYPWWEASEYSLDDVQMVHTEADVKYFKQVEAEIGRDLSEGQKTWYVTTRDNDFGGESPLMWQEYPSTCVIGETYVSTIDGLVQIKDVRPDGQEILNHLEQGNKQVYKLSTRLGYSVTCTADHRILCADGLYRELQHLHHGIEIQMARPRFGLEIQCVEYSTQPFVKSKIEITPDFAQFVGLYMGDGSFYQNTVSIACDSQDLDVISYAKSAMNKYLGGSAQRFTGSKKGCIELRKSNTGLLIPFLELGLIEQRPHGGYKRNVHVPAYIMRSTKTVAAAFLRGLFEADGFASRDGCSIKFFSKYEHVVCDLQILLLAFGIESRVSKKNKTNSNNYEYEGWELVLRANGVRKYAVEIGFISKRKQERANLSLSKRQSGSTHVFNWSDTVKSIEPRGEAKTFDITTITSNFIAGGLVVHNCGEAFQQSTEGCWFASQIALARQQGRIRQALPVEAAPVNTFWDVGRGDMTAIWFHQRVGPENRFIRYYEASGEDLIHYVQYLQRTGYVFNKHYLPHECDYKRMGETPDLNRSIKEMLENLMPGQRFEIVPRVTAINTGIQATRNVFSSCWFDQAGCDQGIKRISNYRKHWDKTRGCWTANPVHDDNSHGSDAFRQFGQEADAGNLFTVGLNSAGKRPRRRGSAMAV